MLLRMLRDWRTYKAGRIITPHDGVANVLIRRKIAEQVTDEVSPPKQEPAKKRGR